METDITESKNISLKYSNLLISIFFLSLLPFLILFIYIHPVADDYFFIDRLNNAGFISALKSVYHNWSGRFFSHAELLLFPQIFKTLDGYKIFALVSMLALFGCLYLFISEFTQRKISKKEKLIFTLSVIFLYLYQMSSVGQGFYWFLSYAVYHNTIIFLLLFFISFNRLTNSNSGINKIYYTILCCFLAVAVGGSNEISMIILNSLLLLFILKNIYLKKWNWSLFLIFLTLLFTTYIVMSSSGTEHRANVFSGNRNFTESFLNSFPELFKNLFSWSFLSPLFAVTFLLIPVFVKLNNDKFQTSLFFKNPPFFLFVISLLILNAGFFISYYGLGRIPYDRTINFIYFLFLILWFYNVINLIVYFEEKHKLRVSIIPKYYFAAGILVVILYLFKDNNIKYAYEDLMNGTAVAYDKEQDDRYKIIEACKSDTCEVDKLNNLPKSFFMFDISKDPGSIYNKWYSKYYKKNVIKLKN